MNIERERLLANVQGPEGWKHWGPYLSERQWGTVREDYSPGGAQPRLPVGRGWHRGGLRRRAVGVPVACTVEWRGSDFEGAHVRPHQR
jgi:hypothetical protein